MKVDGITGSVEAGKRAGIIIVNDDPLQNISNIRKVQTVLQMEIFMILLRHIRLQVFNKQSGFPPMAYEA